jgi:predicted GIY-YIG superfamily endonuclease
MKKYVYELVNLMGTIEYVGETVRPKIRFNEHKSKDGKFYGRQDISMYIVKEFDNKKEAWNYQCQLQKEYGLITDSEQNSKKTKGRTCPIKGKNHSIETKQKMSEAKKGKTISEETKLKLSLAAKLDWVKRKSTNIV